MAQSRKTRNLFGFGKRKTAPAKRRPSAKVRAARAEERETVSSLIDKAYAAGHHLGREYCCGSKMRPSDTEAARQFSDWISRQNVSERIRSLKATPRAYKHDPVLRHVYGSFVGGYMDASKEVNPKSRRARTIAKRAVRSLPTAKNCESSTEYRLGYNLGQTDRQGAQLGKTHGELQANYRATFGGVASPEGFERFEYGYIAGYSLGSPGVVVSDRVRAANRATARNPETADEEYEQAKKTAELFHGRPVKEEITVDEQIRTHDWYVSIGPLINLKVKPLSGKPQKTVSLPFPKSGDDVVHLFCSPDGRQFYLRGGDQELDLKALGMGEGTEWFRDHMLIGEAKEITYQDRKKFHKFNLTEYYHKLGEVTRVKPMFAYDSLAHKMSIIGGQYKVEMDDLVDGMSPGIVN